MRSIRTILVRNFVGAIFAIFLIVYYLFNVVTNNFISAEAYRELSKGVFDIETFNIHSGLFHLMTPIESMPSDASAIFIEPSSNIIHSAPIYSVSIDTPNIIHSVPIDAPNIIHIDDMIISRLQYARPLSRVMINADGIIINDNNEIISPNIHFLGEYAISEIMFLSNYYVQNKNSFENSNMVRVSGNNNTYYLMAVSLTLTDDLNFSVLFYTDITSAILFMGNINQTLGILLFATGIIGVLISAFMSSRIQKSIVRLCNYAEVVGQGKFEEKVEIFDYKEFSNLAQSMNNMSNMLSAYENDQKQFFQNVSHELRTPLMSIQGYAEGILENVLEKGEALEIILSESAIMAGLVSQLLYVSRMDSGLDTLNITSVNIKNLLYDCAGRVKILAEKNNKEISFDFPSTDTEIKADEEKLQTAIDNIISNCIRYAKSKIEISYEIDKENQSITIIISDDGNGINNDDLPHIFKRFYKGANGNSGLGLAISNDIIKKLGGKIIAENIFTDSDIPSGAKFEIIVTLDSYALNMH